MGTAGNIKSNNFLNQLGEMDSIINGFVKSKGDYQKLSSSLFEDLCKFERDSYEMWTEDISELLEQGNGELSLKKAGNLIELNFETGKLQVNYGERLVTLIREVRKFTSMGFSVPSNIQRAAEDGLKFYRFGSVLQQVANLYNSIDQQMLPSQQAMLLDTALEFERIIKASSLDKSITWKTPEDLNLYISRLQKAGDKLVHENRRLRKHHETVVETVKDLMGIDLVKSQSKWKEKVNFIRGVINTVTEGGVKLENTLAWRNHWDFQLYKAFEHQYQYGLESLSEMLPEIKIEIIYKQQKLQFRPSFEDIKAKYYREMKKFINLPFAFKPLGETNIFESMIEQNAYSLIVVYQKAEKLFQSLSKTLDLFEDWVTLGSVDLESFIENALSDISEWDFNFKRLKQKGKELEGIPNVIVVDCFTISTQPVKNAIDDLLQNLFDALVGSLRKGAMLHLKTIEQFTTTAMELLLQRPESMADVGNANALHAELSKSKASIQNHFEGVETKNKLLKSVSGSSVDSSIAKAKWTKLELMLESHELMIREQVEVLRNALDTRVSGLMKDIEKFSLRWNQLKPKSSEINIFSETKKVMDFLKSSTSEFEEIKLRKNQLDEDCKHFGADPVDIVEIETLSNDLGSCFKLWSQCEEYYNAMEGFRTQDWISYRGKSGLFEEFINVWNDKVRQNGINSVTSVIIKDLDSYREFLSHLKHFKGENWTSEHWGEFFRLIKIPKGVGLSELTYGHLMDLRIEIVSNISKIIDLNLRAEGEVSIREAIQELEIWGASACFTLFEHKDTRQCSIYLIKDWKETLTQIGDNLSMLQSLKDSPYYQNFADRAATWEKKLSECDEYSRQLNSIQRKWLYLEPIFTRGALPSEQSRFDRIDEELRNILNYIRKDPRLVILSGIPGVKNSLLNILDQLDRCQKALNEYLEQKRGIFPRFYFIGDDDLLEILGQAKNPEVIQNHLKKLFAGVHSVVFDQNFNYLISMRSIQGELVTLNNPVPISDEVEVWLEKFSMEMKNTLHNLLLKCMDRSDIFNYPSQILCLSENIRFTSEIEAIITTKCGYSELLSKLELQLEKYTSIDINSIEDKTERCVLDLKVKSLILDVIHFIDVINQLKEQDISNIHDWKWRKQIRFYLNDRRECLIRMHDGEFRYSYEYQGNPPKLVHTPLTDKCYLTLTQAMSAGFGGNPFGPAGTGKTESVKALGNLFGRQVLVFNCDEGIDYKSMGRIFVGLVKCGAWGCFDEFNRLEEAVLSAVSQQIQVIQASLKKKSPTVTLLGKEVNLDHNAAVFVTLNPAGKGYGGRQKLPDNLKQLFRSVAMTHPNYELIAEVILLSEGFKEGKVLGRKIVDIFSLAKQFLTSQQHYDWGLRPMKAVLSLAGALIHEEKKHSKSINESYIAVKALRASIISKLTFGDTYRFNLLLADLFPGLKIEDMVYDSMKQALKDAYSDLGLVFIEHQASKVFQLFEACRQRMGVVIVGPSGSGKTTVWKLLERLYFKLGQKLILHKSNPKAVERHMLLGHMDMDTREWFDGIITAASRQAVKESLDTHSWILCDGDIDPEWVESLNSVLDDNRLLTMPNGERIQFGPNVNFIFETHNLKYASPATVSRMGMIYLSDEDLDVNVILDKWISSNESKAPKSLREWMENYFKKGVELIATKYSTVVETTNMGTIMTALSNLGGVKSRTEYVHRLIRGLGSNLNNENRFRLATDLLQLTGEKIPDPKKVLDYFVDPNGDIQQYDRSDPSPLDISYFSDIESFPVVETPNMKKCIDTIFPWLKNGDPLLLVGPEGCGKFTTLKHCFSKLRNTSVTTIHCSSQTKSSQVLQRLYQRCICTTTSNGRVLKPKDSEKMILYLKDVNLPTPDKYETVELIQFLQQLILYHGVFNEDLEWVSIEGIQIVASMNPSGTAGRYPLSSRFTSIVRICFMDYNDRDSLIHIYKILITPILEHYLSGHEIWSLPKNLSKLASTFVDIYDEISKKFTVDQYSHYIFTPRDLTRVLSGITSYSLTNDASFLEIVFYEFQRVFQDKIVGDEAQSKLKSIIESKFKLDWDWVASGERFVFSRNSKAEGLSQSQLCNPYMNRIAIQEYSGIIRKKLQVYEKDIQDLNWVLFPELLEQLSRIERILCQPSGSLVLAGKAGIGFDRMVTFIGDQLGFQIFSPKISSKYTYKAFLNDLKEALRVSGVENENSIFMVEDYQLISPSFLGCLNTLLSGSEVGSIYTPEEIEMNLNSIKEEYSRAGFHGTLYEFFTSRIRKNLHITIILDNSEEDFVSKCESNPALFTKCQILWVDKWSKESYGQIITERLLNSKFLEDSDKKPDTLADIISIHNSAHELGSPPKYFTEFVQVFESVYVKKQNSIKKNFNYLKGGLAKLSEAAKFVDKLSAEANLQQIELAQKQKEADLALKEITESMVKAADQKTEMEALNSKLAKEETEILARKRAVELELADVEPIIKAAKSAVGEIKSESLTEIRSLRAPPPAVRDVLEAVLRLMGNLDMSWNSMKSFLGKRTVKEEILNFDARSISKATREAVAELIKKNQNSFEDSVIRRASVAAAPLAAWAKANIQYAEVTEKVAPLEKDLSLLIKSLDSSKNRLMELKQALDIVDQKVEELKNSFGSKTRDAEVLKSNLEKALNVMERANSLLEKLSGEGVRWKMQQAQNEESLKSLLKDSILSAAFVVYLSNAPEDKRQYFQNTWVNITKHNSTFNFKNTISTESEHLQWKSRGLPADTLSIENAAIVIESSAIPLLIDPSGQSIVWLKNQYAEKKPELINYCDENFTRSLEMAVRFGKMLIVQEISEIPPFMIPLLRRVKKRNGSRYTVEIGDKCIDYSDGFKLILCTQNSDFAVPKSMSGFINCINFTVTKSGLIGQLLGITIKHKKPELEEQKVELLKQEETLKLQLAELEQKLLQALANAEGNILEDQTLLESLNETKEKSSIIQASLIESLKLNTNLDTEREKFKSISEYASTLYFVMMDLIKLNSTYQFSLKTFLKLFNRALNSDQSSDSSDGDGMVKHALEKLVYEYVARSLFKDDRLSFAIHLIKSTRQDLSEKNEWDVFLGNTPTFEDKPTVNIDWIPEEFQKNLKLLGVFLK
jgi:dynein heavy chain 2